MFKLLIVEDGIPLLDKMANNIDWEANEYLLSTATNGLEALPILVQEDIDIMVTDIRMPKMDGMELIKKGLEIKPDLKTVIISGHAEFEYAQQSIRLGVTDYLLKPFRSQSLLEVVNKIKDDLLNQRKEQAELDNIRESIVNELKVDSEKDRFRKLFDSTISEEFYQKHAVIFDNQKLFQNLKSGTKEDIDASIKMLIESLTLFNIKEDEFYLFINSIVLLAFRSLNEMGFTVEELLEKMDFAQQLPAEEFTVEKFNKWIHDFFHSLHQAVQNNNLSFNKKVINEIKTFVKENFAKGITLGELAHKFNMSSSNLSQLFLRIEGMNFTEYLNELRVNKAKELLKTTDLKIYSIADQVGFNDSYYFSSWFKKIVGVSPTTYRENIDLL